MELIKDRRNRSDLNIGEYLMIASGTGVFRPDEIDVLKEVLEDYGKSDTTYHVYEERSGGKLSGFAIFGRTPLTAFCWDVYWLVVDKACHGKGTGKRLMTAVEEAFAEENKKFVARVETSGRDTYEGARIFYEKLGYEKTGVIPHFYGQGDDLVMYHKNGAGSRV
ncbi:MAG TPA: GNAT family N-acetyltransferase [Candidatus Omnitrophota bacterium]|nr:GNAT family N-acetyltransferase [Candidatus Omnitrophota bacterium]HPS20651.1 GNAT family N-acetyltransferase [Candidatus Omnitrophota bacterium]